MALYSDIPSPQVLQVRSLLNRIYNVLRIYNVPFEDVMNDEKYRLLCVFNPLNVVQNLYYRFSFGTIEYLSIGGERG